ncbi:MAG: aldose 1-epimerase [Acidobacteriia bacterium]|nr:aldose 1-epimerase [Terriglobia bacterium]
MKTATLAVLLPLMTFAANYSARRTVVDGIEVVELADAAHHLEVSIAPSIGNMAYEIKAGGKNILWFPYHSPADLKARPVFCCVPFLAPWANRLDDDSYWANGKKYLLNPDLGNVRRDNHQKPIHGLLSFSPAWTLVSADADARSAYATSRIEFWKHPEMMAQFPFAHTITMTYRLQNGEVEVETTVDNHSTDPLPVALGYHPYFQLNDAPRDQWKVHLAARDHLVLSNLLIPTGERQPVEFADPHPLHASQLDDVFGNLVRSADGRAQFWVEGNKQRITVTYGPKYTVAVVYAPAVREFICFEPMAAITNAFNLAHSGVYRELQSIPAGGQWKESFWIAPSGF